MNLNKDKCLRVEYESKSTGNRYLFLKYIRDNKFIEVLYELDKHLGTYHISTYPINTFKQSVLDKKMKLLRKGDWKRTFRRELRSELYPLLKKIIKNKCEKSLDKYMDLRVSHRDGRLSQEIIFKEEVSKFFKEQGANLYLFEKLIKNYDFNKYNRLQKHNWWVSMSDFKHHISKIYDLESYNMMKQLDN